MSNVVAPLPSGLGVTMVAEHRPRRDPESRHSGDDEAQPDANGSASDGDRKYRPRPGAPPAADEPVVPAETLFAAALFANEMTPQLLSADELKLRQGHGWTPPDSALRLKDKLI